MSLNRALVALKGYLGENRIRLGQLAVVWFLVSLFLPAVRYGSDIGVPGSWWVWGFYEFLLGPFGIFVLQPSWYANIIILAAINFFLGGRILHWGWALFSVSLAACALLEYGRNRCLGGCSMATEFGIGYWLWLALAAFITIVSFIDRLELKIGD